MHDANWFTVLVKAFVEQFEGQAPNQKQWDMFVEILKEIPTERLVK